MCSCGGTESLCVLFVVGYLNVLFECARRAVDGAGGVGAPRCGGSRWARGFGAMRQWERGRERGVSVCLFVTFCHCSKYAFTVVRCLRLEGVSLLHTALFSVPAKPCTDHSAVTVITGPQGPAFLCVKRSGLLRGSIVFLFRFLCCLHRGFPAPVFSFDVKKGRSCSS